MSRYQVRAASDDSPCPSYVPPLLPWMIVILNSCMKNETVLLKCDKERLFLLMFPLRSKALVSFRSLCVRVSRPRPPAAGWARAPPAGQRSAQLQPGVRHCRAWGPCPSESRGTALWVKQAFGTRGRDFLRSPYDILTCVCCYCAMPYPVCDLALQCHTALLRRGSSDSFVIIQWSPSAQDFLSSQLMCILNWVGFFNSLKFDCKVSL